jgi:hypothetical protein
MRFQAEALNARLDCIVNHVVKEYIITVDGSGFV